MKKSDEIEDALLNIFEHNEELDRERQLANAELIGILAQFIIENPTQRFAQVLVNLDIITSRLPSDGIVQWNNEYNTEPRVMVKRAKAALKRFKK